MVSLDTEVLRVHLQVNGDAFIGRTYDNGDDFKRLNFTVSEVSSSAAWVKVNVLCLEFCSRFPVHSRHGYPPSSKLLHHILLNGIEVRRRHV